jgi:hypothetical protein
MAREHRCECGAVTYEQSLHTLYTVVVLEAQPGFNRFCCSRCGDVVYAGHDPQATGRLTIRGEGRHFDAEPCSA